VKTTALLAAFVAAFLCLVGAVRAESPHAAVTAAAHRNGVPVALAHAVAKRETNYRCHARGRDGEQGIMQVMPATARSVGVHGNLFNCRIGAEAGVRYLKLALRKSGGHYGHAATLYNAGLGSRSRGGSYARAVVRFAAR
jgi:soluble lytic murein transglycosylase-like protein